VNASDAPNTRLTVKRELGVCEKGLLPEKIFDELQRRLSLSIALRDKTIVFENPRVKLNDAVPLKSTVDAKGDDRDITDE
jgi:hypothetical protein